MDNMYKQEEYHLNSGFTPPDMNSGFEETYHVITESPPFDMGINMNDLMPMISGGNSGGLLTLPLEEATMDVAQKFEEKEFVPVSPRGPPERKVFAGDFDFQVEINARDVHKKKYLYSSKLNRIYVDMKIDFPVSFRWSPLPYAAGIALWVRAAVVFSDESQAEKRVERCTQHTHESNQDLSRQEIVKNVLHSSREMGTQGVYYCGQPEVADSWYSVLVELPPSGGSHAFRFVCKNSCSSGINRRAIDVIFTLEDANGQVLGRQTVGARVCSCIRRDMDRDERDETATGGKKRVSNTVTSQQQPKTKKVKIETSADDELVTLPAIQVVGVRSALAILQTALSTVETAAGLRPDLAPSYRPAAALLRKQIADFTHAHPQPKPLQPPPPSI